MPTYEYACSDCGEHIEVFQSFSDEPLASCPNCGGSMRKVFGSIGIVLKGSGFYRTDSRSARGKPTSSDSTKAAKDKEPASHPAPATGASDAGASSSGSKEPSPAPSSAPKAVAAR